MKSKKPTPQFSPKAGRHDRNINWPHEFLRPWKLTTLALGIILLLIGSVVTPAPDWDVGVSFIMAVLTYLTAPWFIHVFRRLNWKMIPLALFMRPANAFASTFLYLLMGMVWMYPGSLRDLLNETRRASQIDGSSSGSD